jgi:hypothetical protein
MEEHPRRDQTQRAQPRPLHGGQGNPRLAAARGERDDTAATSQFPCGECGLLVRSQVEPQPGIRNLLDVGADVGEGSSGLEQPTLERRVAARGRPMGLDTRVPDSSRRRGDVEIPGGIDQQDRPAVESEPHDRRLDRTGAPAPASMMTAWCSSIGVWTTTAGDAS